MPKNTAGKKPSVKVNDMRAKKNPKGGAPNLANYCATGKHIDKVVITNRASTIKGDVSSLSTLGADALKIK